MSVKSQKVVFAVYRNLFCHFWARVISVGEHGLMGPRPSPSPSRTDPAPYLNCSRMLPRTFQAEGAYGVRFLPYGADLTIPSPRVAIMLRPEPIGYPWGLKPSPKPYP